MSRPTDDPQWATNTNYGFGPYPGQPNKARPASGVIAEGFDPGVGVPAEWLNYLANNHGSYLKYLDDILSGSGFYLADDFLANSFATTVGPWSDAGIVTQGNDATNGAYGILNVDANAGTPDGYAKTTVQLPVGTNDFYLETRVALDSLGGKFYIGFRNGSGLTDGTLGFFVSDSSTNWTFTSSFSGNPNNFSLDLGLSHSATGYHVLKALRVSGVVFCEVDNSGTWLSHAAPDAPSSLCNFYIQSKYNSSTCGRFVDNVKLWIAR
jgi:hypothetical protein